MKDHRKYVEGADATELLRREAEQLRAASHPGVVEVLRFEASDGGAELVTVGVPGSPLHEMAAMPAHELAGLAAAVATTLADLHDRDLVHGAVTARHIIVRNDGFGVLCGFGSGGRTGELPPGAARVLDPHDDVVGLAAILRQLATGPDGRSLRAVANRSIEGAPPMTARGLAAELQGVERDSRQPFRSATSEPASAGRLDSARRTAARSGRRSPLLVALAATTIAGIGLLGATGVGPSGPSAPDPLPSGGASTIGGASTSTPAGAGNDNRATATMGPSGRGADASKRPCAEAHAILVADVDDDGCNDVLRFTDGVLEGAGRLWTLGRAGDVVVAGDWACSGRRTLALLRPVTGDVVWFDSWAQPGHDLRANPVDRVEGGQAMRAADIDGDGCHELVVERADGSSQLLRPGGRDTGSTVP